MKRSIKCTRNCFERSWVGKHYLYLLPRQKELRQAEKVLETSAPRNGGSRLDKAIEEQPYFGTIMRSGSKVFDDSLEVFKAAKQGKEQEKYK